MRTILGLLAASAFIAFFPLVALFVCGMAAAISILERDGE